MVRNKSRLQTPSYHPPFLPKLNFNPSFPTLLPLLHLELCREMGNGVCSQFIIPHLCCSLVLTFFPCSSTGPMHGIQSFMNCSKRSPSQRLQFFKNGSIMDPLHGAQSFRNRLLQLGSSRGPAQTSLQGLQLLPGSSFRVSSPWSAASIRSLPPAVALGPPWAAVWVSVLTRSSMGCRWTVYFTIVTSTGFRVISALVPETPPPHPCNPPCYQNLAM